MIDLDTWIISDTHFGHEAITRMCNRPEYVDALMRRKWSENVQADDTVLHLGDIMTWKNKESPESWMRTLSKLEGEKLFVRGNHDKHVPENWTEVGTLLGEFVEEDVTREGVPYTNKVRNHGLYSQLDGKRILFSHYPDNWLLDWDVNIHGHIHNNPYSPKIDRSRNYINVSVEVMDYTPVRLSAIL
jgi:calcineurin-like phosphoesterase family protein